MPTGVVGAQARNIVTQEVHYLRLKVPAAAGFYPFAAALPAGANILRVSTATRVIYNNTPTVAVGTRFDAEGAVANAINTAIDAYRAKRFVWAESRTACVFNTVAAQEFYDALSSGAAALARLRVIDYVASLNGSQPYQLRRLRPEAAEWLGAGTSTCQPIANSWYEKRLRLYPLPSGVFQIRVAGLFSVAAPANDVVIHGLPVSSAETLIRCRAKAELAEHRMQDTDLADRMKVAADAALSQLTEETTGETGTGYVEPYW